MTRDTDDTRETNCETERMRPRAAARRDAADRRDRTPFGSGRPDADRGVGSSRRRFLQLGASALAATALGSATVGAQTRIAESCGSFDTLEVGDGDFLLINNDWGGDVDMCIWAADDGSYGYEWETRTTEGEPNYPQALLGTKPWGDDTGVDEFPIRRGAVDELELTFDVDVDIAGGEWNLAEEWWLMDGRPDPNDPPHTHEIMLVLDWGGGHEHETVLDPEAIEDAHGNVIDHWISYDSGGTAADFHIFRLADPATTGTVDLTAIMEYVETEIGGVSDDLLLSGVELGTEYWVGTAGEVAFNAFDVTVNGRTYSSGDGSTGGDGGNGDDDGDGGDGDDPDGDDYPAWNPDDVYTEGDRVTHDGTVWEAQWWTRGDEPRDEEWYVWRPVEEADDDSDDETEDDTSPTWESDEIYTAGDRVTYDGTVWEAQWWTQGDAPDETWFVWQPVE